MTGSRPGYLRRVVVRRRGIVRGDDGAVVVLRSLEGRSAGAVGDLEVVLGRVVAHRCGGSGRVGRARTASWTFVREWPRRASGCEPGWYRSCWEAAESCAVEAIDGPGARRRFDLERCQRWRPEDN
jgi:hypothetical protein